MKAVSARLHFPILGGCTIATIAMLFVAQAHAAELPPPGPTSLLIRYRVVSTDSFTEITSKLDAFIFRDGLIIERLTDDVGKCLVVRASALPERLSRLKVALGINRVDRQQGNCTNEPPGDYTAVREVTWFGRGRRQHSYRYGLSVSGERCPSEIDQIDHAITSVLAGATDALTEQTCP